MLASDVFREQWRFLLANPERDEVAAEIAAPFERELDEARQALLSEAQSALAVAVGRLLRGALIVEFVRRRAPYVVGPYARELRSRVSGSEREEEDDACERDEETEEQERTSAAAAGLPDPYLAWTLGDMAEEAPEAERPALVDRAIDAFDAIALAPISPGNDAGPFTRLAHLMDEPQVRRALAITERMTGADWSFTGDWGSHEDLSHARAHLTARLAELGHLDEAEALLAQITDGASRATAIGRIRGHRIAQGGTWRSPFVDPPRVDAPHFLDLLRGLTRVLEVPDHPPPEDLLEDCIARVRSEDDPAIRTSALTVMVDWFSVGAAERWFLAIRDYATGWLQVDALFRLAALAEAPEDRRAAARSAIEKMLALPDRNHVRWLDAIYAVRAALPLGEMLVVVATMIITTARSSHALLFQELHGTHDLEALLRWIGGDDALRAATEALDDVERLLQVDHGQK